MGVAIRCCPFEYARECYSNAIETINIELAMHFVGDVVGRFGSCSRSYIEDVTPEMAHEIPESCLDIECQAATCELAQHMMS